MICTQDNAISCINKKRFQWTIKRFFDIILSLLGIIFCIPVLIVCYIAIKLDSPGPLLFTQNRIGRNNKQFKLLKLRTMTVEQPQTGSTSLLTVCGDSRITRTGAILRKTKIDELPQLFNVLRGDMSLVGPRPQVAKYVNYYNDIDMLVLLIRPGITGAASFFLYNEEAILRKLKDPEKSYIKRIIPLKTKLNLKYIKNYSLGLDIYFIVITVLRVFIKSYQVTKRK